MILRTKTLPPVGGKCHGEYEELFLSPFAEPFDKDSFLDDFPDATLTEIKVAQDIHSIKHIETVARCQQVCYSCPFYQQCQDWGLDFEQAVFGVVGGLTERERVEIRVGKSVSGKHILSSTESPDITAMAKRLLGE